MDLALCKLDIETLKKLTQIQDVVKTKDGSYVLVDSIYTTDRGFETMVFACDENGNCVDYADLDVDHYANIRDTADGHKRMVAKWSDTPTYEELKEKYDKLNDFANSELAKCLVKVQELKKFVKSCLDEESIYTKADIEKLLEL